MHPNRLPGERLDPIASAPFLLIHLVPLLAIFTGITAQSILIFAVTYWTRVFFITAGYHRYFAHRAFKTSRWFQLVLAVGAISSLQKGVLWWSGHHRLHHRFTDTVSDAHSPIKGVLFSHIGWIITPEHDPTPTHAIADFAKYPELRFLDRFHHLPPIALALGCLWWGGLPGLVVGFFASTVVLWHCTFLVNSMAHLWGTRRFATPDSSRNNALVAFLTMGEGWHNNHHHMPTAARQGLRWFEFDATFAILRVLAMLRIVRDLKPHYPALTRTARLDEGAYDIGMFQFHWDKATTKVAAATGRDDVDDVRVEFSLRADAALAAARQLGRRTRYPAGSGPGADDLEDGESTGARAGVAPYADGAGPDDVTGSVDASS
ncbi:MAG: acyl-CoA desaturase [Microthrixaceae bacterium]